MLNKFKFKNNTISLSYCYLISNKFDFSIIRIVVSTNFTCYSIEKNFKILFLNLMKKFCFPVFISKNLLIFINMVTVPSMFL